MYKKICLEEKKYQISKHKDLLKKRATNLCLKKWFFGLEIDIC